MIPAEGYVLPSLPFRKMRDLSRRFKYLQPPGGWTAAQGCWVLGCGRPVGPAHGMCWCHLQRVYRRQPVLVMLRSAGRRNALKFGPARPSAAWLRIAGITNELATNWSPEPNTGCHLFLGRCHPLSGYAMVGNRRDPWGGYGHRAVLHFAGVKLERNCQTKHVRHLCNQPACVNPDHLVYGTAKENMADREQRYAREGRPVYRKSRGGKMTREQVAEFKAAFAAGAFLRDLAARYGIVASHAWAIAHGRTWADVPAALPPPTASREAA